MSKSHPGGTLELEIDSGLAVTWNDVVRIRDDMADLSDDSLLGLVRGGSADAYAVLFERHRYPAHRMAAYYANSHHAKDIVAESFAQLYDLLRRGTGPERSFRADLFASVRHEAGRRAAMEKRVSHTRDATEIVRKK
jgi:DNA-directed RNA polymerase specialized sigma24 family protein